jgi:hypothetical protein
MAQLVFGDPDFGSTSQLRDYINNGRLIVRPLYHELHVASEELIAVLSHVKSANPHAFGLDSRVRARIVGAHLRRAGEAMETANSSLVKCYMSFRKHYTNELQAAPKAKRREFRFDD